MDQNPSKRHIVLDTNFLLIPEQFGIDIFTEIDRICHFPYQLCIIDATEGELEKLGKNKGAAGRAANVALVLLKTHSIAHLPAEGRSVDAAIMAHAKSGWVVATQDRELRRKLKLQGVQLLTLRGKSHLTVA